MRDAPQPRTVDAACDAVFAGLRARLEGVRGPHASARLTFAQGTAVRTRIAARIGDLCELFEPGRGTMTRAEVSGFVDGEVVLAPYGEISGLSEATEVRPLGRKAGLLVRTDLCGCLIDPLGRIVQRLAPSALPPSDPVWRPYVEDPPSPAMRRPITRPLITGVRAIDAFTTLGQGQRVGVFGSAGAGKTTLMTQILRGADADVLVMGLVGERGREIAEFAEAIREGAFDPSRCVMVGSTSDRPARERLNGALAAASIAAHFSGLGLRVLLLVDSVTRVARALRELGLSAGEPATRRGFPPSVFAFLPRLLERAGQFETGSVTAIYTVLAEGDIQTDPVVEEVKSLVDGHVYLSSELLAGGRMPAIDVLTSASRVMANIADETHRAAAIQVRRMLSLCAEVALLRRLGEYQSGADPETDRAIARLDEIEAFLRQPASHRTAFPETLQRLVELAR